MRRLLSTAGVGIGLLAVGPASAAAVSLEPIGTFASPVHMTSDPRDPDRLFVVEQAGRIKLSSDAATATFLDIADIVLSPGEAPGSSERGLLSMAFAPDFSTTGRFYVFYTGTDDGTLHVDELVANGDVADLDSRRTVISIPHPTFPNHNGGQLQFGPDGYLYLSTGDGGGAGDPGENAQDLRERLGKILRIEPHPPGGVGYGVPADNPFVGTPDAAPEIWSYGLRNPWRFSFDRETGALLIADVGQAAWEEIDYEPVSAGAGRGDNFGWDCFEGSKDYPPDTDPACATIDHTPPVFEYPHNGSCSVTGGYVVRDASLGDLYGRYVYADYCAGQLRSLVPGLPLASGDRSEGIDVANPTSFGEDACGRIYVVSHAGPVHRLVGPEPADCPPPTPPDPDSGDGAPGPLLPSPDVTAPALQLQGKDPRRSRSGRRIPVLVSSDEPATIVLRAKLRGGGEWLFRLHTKTRRGPLDGELVHWKLKPERLRRARAVKEAGRRVRAVVKAHAVDEVGNPAMRRLVLELVKRGWNAPDASR